MELRPELTTRQQTALSPRLYQSMKILRLSAPDLLELLHKELDENPALEIPEPSDYDHDAGLSAERQLWEDYVRADGSRQGSFQGERPLNVSELAASPVTLSDHLTLQLDLEGLPVEEHRIGLALIGSLDDDGYLRDSVECIAGAIGEPAARVEQVLTVLQGLDPPGVGARDLEECLRIQLLQMKAGRLAVEIVARFLPEVARNAYGEIARAVKAPLARVEKAVALIRELNPVPGSLFDVSPPAGAVIPDVFLLVEEGRVRVLANRETLPPLKLNQVYQELAAAGEAGPETVDYIKNKIRDATRLIRDLKQRRATITRVAEAIAGHQPDFFTRGPAYLRPLSIEDIARELEVHPSTISRAILGKYMNTPFGIFEFRYFFSSGYTTAGGERLAANAVKKRISELIAREDARKPLSDQKIATLLAGEEIRISRRTVAKYREEMGALPSWQRKKIGICRDTLPGSSGE
ncbi:MAG: RNA polymerase sigma-54 factor [Gaiellales bacterium]|nr:MAG: RNA polymerase sigma-54 factor [Gaiellales bacterium]